ncbi:MAG: hypothetical protein KAU17_13565 [Spirochaetales bacterium]|jgi:hypothetical protein|nr:hypothetical protein [Spirochaetales bacterium]
MWKNKIFNNEEPKWKSTKNYKFILLVFLLIVFFLIVRNMIFEGDVDSYFENVRNEANEISLLMEATLKERYGTEKVELIFNDKDFHRKKTVAKDGKSIIIGKYSFTIKIGSDQIRKLLVEWRIYPGASIIEIINYEIES